MAKSINLNIGDVSISIAGNSQIVDWEIDPQYFRFVTVKKNRILRVNMVRGEPDNGAAKKFFGSYPIWDLYRSNGNFNN